MFISTPHHGSASVCASIGRINPAPVRAPRFHGSDFRISPIHWSRAVGASRF